MSRTTDGFVKEERFVEEERRAKKAVYLATTRLRLETAGGRRLPALGAIP